MFQEILFFLQTQSPCLRCKGLQCQSQGGGFGYHPLEVQRHFGEEDKGGLEDSFEQSLTCATVTIL